MEINLHGCTSIEMEEKINNIVGVVTNGLFAKRPADVVLVGENGSVNQY